MGSGGAGEGKWDVFVCHAHEDKEAIARPLAAALRNAGLSTWFDEVTLRIGDSLRRSIDRGLASARYGVVILSHNFFRKHWPQAELDALAGREVDGQKVILPVWHDIAADEVRGFSPMLADRMAATSAGGLEKIVSEILAVVSTQGAAPGRPPRREQNAAVQETAALRMAAELSTDLDVRRAREDFIHSDEGTRFADSYFNDLWLELQKAADKIKTRFPHLSFGAESTQWTAALSTRGISLTLNWHREYMNSLEDAELVARLWKGRVALNGRAAGGGPRQLAEHVYTMDMDDKGQKGWRPTSGGLVANPELSDRLLVWMLNAIKADEG